MKTIEIAINDRDSLSNVVIDENVRKLILKWGEHSSNLESLFYKCEIDKFIHRLTLKCSHLKVLDLSRLNGAYILNVCVTYLHELYYPETTLSVSLEGSASLRKVSAIGAKVINITKCPNLEEVEFGNDIEELCLFQTGITEIEIPSRVKLTNFAFQHCINLNSVTIGEGTEVPAYTFEGCVNLKEVTLPNDLLVLEPFVFKGCKKLKRIKGGYSIKQLFPSALSECINLEYIESVCFYKYTDLSLSDDDWIKKYRNKHYHYTLDNKRNQIKDFSDKLCDIKIDCPEDYIASNFFGSSQKQYAVFLKYEFPARHWILWSLDQQRFLVSKETSREYKIGTVIQFDDIDFPTIEIEDSFICIYREQKNIELSKVTFVQDSKNEIEMVNDIIMYFSPKESLFQCYERISSEVECLDISAIIDSYFIKTEKWWTIRPGKDDVEWYERVSKSSYSDIYIDKLLPQEDCKRHSFGVCPCGFNSVEESNKLRLADNEEAMRLKEYARNEYSVEKHKLTLLQDYIDKRAELERFVEESFHLISALHFVEYYFIPYQNEISKEKAIKILCNYSVEDILQDRYIHIS